MVFDFPHIKLPLFSLRKNEDYFPDPVLKLNNIEMPVKQYKFLGITFDRKLNFLAHINALKTIIIHMA